MEDTCLSVEKKDTWQHSTGRPVNYISRRTCKSQWEMSNGFTMKRCSQQRKRNTSSSTTIEVSKFTRWKITLMSPNSNSYHITTCLQLLYVYHSWNTAWENITHWPLRATPATLNTKIHPLVNLWQSSGQNSVLVTPWHKTRTMQLSISVTQMVTFWKTIYISALQPTWFLLKVSIVRHGHLVGT